MGQYVRVNTPLITLVKIDPIRLRIEIPERMAPWVKEGQMVDVPNLKRAQTILERARLKQQIEADGRKER